LYSAGEAGTVLRMLYPTPRTDRWDPWIVLILVLAIAAAAAAVRLQL
jgi:hypothetical protein